MNKPILRTIAHIKTSDWFKKVLVKDILNRIIEARIKIIPVHTGYFLVNPFTFLNVEGFLLGGFL